MNNNYTQDFYIEVIRSRNLRPDVTELELLSDLLEGKFEYKIFGISLEVAKSIIEKAFKVKLEGKLAGGPVGYIGIGNFVSTDLQEGLFNIPKTITFGAGGLTVKGEVEVLASGNILVNTDGYYSIKQRFRVGRTGASGESDIFFYAELSSDNGANWNVIGNPIDHTLNSSKETAIFFDIANVYLTEGTLLRNRFARDGGGDDSGDLRSVTPSAELTALGVLPAPSAQITIYKLG